ncbi:MAG: ABC transporter substrate-binding protein [Clostridia bacterium]|nr:ABC transporter substrate-binding protein [Clostridia bacterium]
MKKATKFVTLLLVAVISCLAFAGCKNKNKEVNFNDDPNERVNLVMWVPTAGGLAPSDNDKVLARVNEYLGSVLPNTTLTIKYEDTNSFGAVMTRMFGAEEAFDICFTSFGTNSYFDNARDESFIGFTKEQMLEYAPDIWNNTPADLWEMIKVNDKYYGVVNNQTKARQAGVSLDKTVLRKYIAKEQGLGSYTEVSDSDIAAYTAENFNSFEDVTPFLAYAKELNPTNRFTTSMTDMEAMMYYMGFDDFGKYNVPGVIPVDATSADDIVNQFETEEFKQLIKIFKSWYGTYVDASVLSGGVTSSTYPTLSMRSLGTYKPGVEQEEYVICSKDMVGVGFGEKILTSTSCLTTLSAVSYTSDHPTRALKFLNLLYKDKTLYNMIVYGREGTDYIVKERDANNQPTQIEVFKTAKYKVNNSWAYGNQFMAYPTVKQPKTVWEDTVEFQNEAVKSVAYGFIFNEEPVAAEIANCVNVYSGYYMQLINNTDPYLNSGAGKDKHFYEEFIQALKSAGSDKIIAELKSQFASYLANK